MIQEQMDVVIISNGSKPEYRKMTEDAIASCERTAYFFTNIIVVEQSPGVTYEGAQTIYGPAAFNYNHYCNLGGAQGLAEWILFANNDIEFTEGWQEALLDNGNVCVSPRDPKGDKQKHLTETQTGSENGLHFSGWCFALKREVYEKIGGFDECVNFFCSDDCVIEQLATIGITPTVVYSSVVNHLRSATVKHDPNRIRFTWPDVKRFNKKYNRAKFMDHPGYLKWLKRHP